MFILLAIRTVLRRGAWLPGFPKSLARAATHVDILLAFAVLSLAIHFARGRFPSGGKGGQEIGGRGGHCLDEIPALRFHSHIGCRSPHIHTAQ
jgi:hypothetical protein